MSGIEQWSFEAHIWERAPSKIALEGDSTELRFTATQFSFRIGMERSNFGYQGVELRTH